MNIIESCSRRCLWWTFLVMLVLALVFNFTGLLVWQFISAALPVNLLEEIATHSESFKAGLEQVMPVAAMIKSLYIPITSALFFIFWLLLWGILRGSITRLLRKSDLGDQPMMVSGKKDRKSSGSEVSAAPAADKKEMIEESKRFYLHLLTVLQREGRLIDFFAEDLSAYEDAQIGAAVRSIQDNCKTSLKKHLNPKAVMDQNEGDELVVPADFDTNAIKLTGNVSGEPPFRGILRHKGWRASKLELPTLSAARDSYIIAPAEIEIL
jgi:hypothetical protein